MEVPVAVVIISLRSSIALKRLSQIYQLSPVCVSRHVCTLLLSLRLLEKKSQTLPVLGIDAASPSFVCDYLRPFMLIVGILE